MTLKDSLAIVPIVLGLAACDVATYRPNETTGALTGAIVGGVVGDQFGGGSGNKLATGVGVLIGALVGSEVGRSMDEADRLRANSAVQRAYTAPLGEQIVWSNTSTGNSGSVTPIRDGRSASGQYCREYRQTLIIDGRRETGIGVACQQRDGTWRIVG